jgi:SAM-dependent methyltransferase
VFESYSQKALKQVLAGVHARRGWDFSSMSEARQSVPWEYREVVMRYLRPSDTVLDIGTGGGERLRDLAGAFGSGLGIDVDPAMVRLATENSAMPNLSFRVGSDRLESVPETFDVIISRHAPFDGGAVAAHLRPGGYFITQQVGERNMACVKAALGQPPEPPAIHRQSFAGSELRLLAFLEYDVGYVVRDIESLVGPGTPGFQLAKQALLVALGDHFATQITEFDLTDIFMRYTRPGPHLCHKNDFLSQTRFFVYPSIALPQTARNRRRQD